MTTVKFDDKSISPTKLDQSVPDILRMMQDGARFEGPSHRLYMEHQIPEITGKDEITIYFRKLDHMESVCTGPFRYSA